MLTKQEVFDKAVRGLASQGFKRSVSDDGRLCKYDGPENRHCAIGWITAEAKIDMMAVNGVGIGDFLGPYSPCPPVSDLLGHLSEDFLSLLQAAHDAAYKTIHDGISEIRIDDPEQMKRNLRALAKECQLSTAVLDEVTR